MVVANMFNLRRFMPPATKYRPYQIDITINPMDSHMQFAISPLSIFDYFGWQWIAKFQIKYSNANNNAFHVS